MGSPPPLVGGPRGASHFGRAARWSARGGAAEPVGSVGRLRGLAGPVALGRLRGLGLCSLVVQSLRRRKKAVKEGWGE